MSTASGGTSGCVSFKTDILPLFRPQDISCMSGKGVHLDSFEYMSQPANAQSVYDHLMGTTPPKMPLGGPFWSAAQLDLFHRWMTETPPYQP
ncbi:MAG TPA: hypothetical protein VGZ22_08315 [Isosphaeraceae bacterium]|jgi:hypothetical protein|nr:hypothetical protein [Isosphaeraceae bacterium]